MATLLDNLPVNEFWRVGRVRARLGVLLGLLFLTGPLSDLLNASLGPWHLAALLAGTALFVAGYVAILPPAPFLARHGDRAILVVLGALPAIAIALLLGGAPSSFVALFVYFVAAAGIVLPIRPALAVVGATALGIAVTGAVLGVSRDALAATVLTVVSIGVLMAAFGRVARANRELKATREELARLAVIEERLRIARDLHDLLGHSLSVIALKSELARRLVERDPDQAVAEIDDIQSVARGALADVRRTVQGYRRPSLREELDGARTALEAAGIDCELRDGHLELSEDVEAVLAWAVREGATNVIRHSGAQHCAIRLDADGGRAELEIDDDGDASPDGPPGTGLRGLRERAQRVRGEVEAGVRPEGGFRLRLTVPLART
jgi:two-component system sensor histidine kinase DesK